MQHLSRRHAKYSKSWIVPGLQRCLSIFSMDWVEALEVVAKLEGFLRRTGAIILLCWQVLSIPTWLALGGTSLDEISLIFYQLR